jgi:hypothetical protein
MARGSKPGERRGGRQRGTPNKATREISELAKGYAPAAVKELARLATKAESETARVAAIDKLLDRAFGKARQSVEHSGSIGTYDLTKVSDADLDRLESILGPLAVASGDQSGEGSQGSAAGA